MWRNWDHKTKFGIDIADICNMKWIDNINQVKHFIIMNGLEEKMA